MSLFSKKKKVVCLIKKAEATKDGWYITYHTEIDGRYIKGSVFTNRLHAEDFFERVLSLDGNTEKTDILRTERL